jgi:hypothetical protein
MWLRLFLSVATGLMVVLTWAPTSRSADEQDACRIGAVSPEEYQAIATEIASQPAIDRREVHRGVAGSDGEAVVEAVLRDRIQEVMTSHGSADQGIAAMHALLRSLGAEFMWTDLVDFYQRPSRRWVAAYHYRIDVNRVGVSRLWRPWGRIDIIFLTDESHQTLGDLYQVVFHIPVPFSTGVTGRKEALRQLYACPRAPAETERPVRHQEPAGNTTPLSEQPPSRETLPRGTLEPLDDDALRRVLYGNYVRRLDLERLYDVNDTQYFCSDGKYGEFGGGRASVSGRFSIWNGTVRVVYPKGGISYRRFYVDARGSYYYVEEGTEGETDRSSPIPVSILPKTKGCS